MEAVKLMWFSCADVDRCTSSPCVNGGTCVSQVDSYTCDCLPGYTGLTCQTGLYMSTIYILLTPIEIVLQCAKPIVFDHCVLYWLRSLTSRPFSDVDECASSPCVNGGACVNLVNEYQCNCVSGFMGRDCEISELSVVGTWITVSTYLYLVHIINLEYQCTKLSKHWSTELDAQSSCSHWYMLWRNHSPHCVWIDVPFVKFLKFPF